MLYDVTVLSVKYSTGKVRIESESEENAVIAVEELISDGKLKTVRWNPPHDDRCNAEYAREVPGTFAIDHEQTWNNDNEWEELWLVDKTGVLPGNNPDDYLNRWLSQYGCACVKKV